MISYTTQPNPYPNPRDLLAEDDHIEMDISVEGWSHTLRIRSLTVPQRMRINTASGIGSDRDWLSFHALTLAEGVVSPRLNPTMARELAESHNGELIEQLSEAIWGLGSLFKTYTQYRNELKALNDAKAQLPSDR
jgi:hypothetical protein